MASFTWHNVFEVYPCCSLYQYFISFYSQIIFPRMNMAHFIYPLVGDEHLCCFHLLGIMHNAVVCKFLLLFTCSRYKSLIGYMIFKNFLQGFPGGAVVENPPANAGDTGSSPGPGRSHVPRSSWARAPQLLSLRVWSLCAATREAAIVRGPRTAMKSGLRSPQLEKALAQKRRPNTAINE